ncbi:CocE/NonD family hydrolase [Streptomyces longisporoflavus]|uniref:CocE/NonD family hydrolase n=1 Tax=Streptomyces longisporoflavus TaxID=28044 RepID=A0ABW7R004_9ACTN
MSAPPAPDVSALMEVEYVRDVRIPTTDASVSLGADLYLPIGAGPVPLIVMVLPYRKDFGGADMLLRYFARRGYAGLIVDVRGTGSSDGELRPPFSEEEGQDAVDAICWGAEQPWCDGSVGMWGHSYGSLLTMRAAALRPAPLKAIIPVQGPVDPEVDFVHPDHARGGLGPASWITGMAGNLLVPPMHAPDDKEALARWRRRLDRSEGFLLDLFRHEPGDAAWRDRAVDTAAIEVPALCFVGLRDLFAESQTRAFEAMKGPKRLVAGPWMHTWPVVADEGPLDFLGVCEAWWDRWLKEEDNGADTEPSAIYVQGPAPRWAALDTWPDEHISARSHEPGPSDVRLELTRAPETSDPTVGALSGLTRQAHARFGMPADQHEDDMGSVCWTSEPLEEALAIVGRPEVRLGHMPSERMVAKLTHVDPARRSVFITSKALGEGAEAAPPESSQPAVLRLDITAYEIPAGHRLRLVLADADFPRLWPLAPSRLPEPSEVSVSLPVLTASARRDVRLPEEPAYLSALLLASADDAPRWVIEREMSRRDRTMRFESSATSSPTEAGMEMDSSSRLAATVAPSGEASVTCEMDWSIRWPSHPPITVRVSSTASDQTFTLHGHVAHGDDVTFDHTWTTSRAATDSEPTETTDA